MIIKRAIILMNISLLIKTLNFRGFTSVHIEEERHVSCPKVIPFKWRFHNRNY